MAVRFHNARFNRLIASIQVVFRFSILCCIKVQVNTVFLNGLPREEALDLFAKRTHCVLVRSDERQHIPIDARRCTTRIQNVLGGLNG